MTAAITAAITALTYCNQQKGLAQVPNKLPGPRRHPIPSPEQRPHLLAHGESYPNAAAADHCGFP